MEALQAVDKWIIEMATQLGGQEPVRDSIVFLLAEILPLTFIGVAVWLFFFSGKTKPQRERNQYTVLVSLASVLFAVAVRYVLMSAVNRPRPFATYPDLHRVVDVSAGLNSFPSLHSILVFAFAGSIYWLGKHRTLGITLLILATLVAIARVVAGVHYASDVIAGAVLGLGVARLVTWQSKYVSRQIT
jgi:undecaprenyl-diphosphatase